MARRRGADILVNGPRGRGRLVKRRWGVTQRLVIFVVNGQSNSLGVTANAVDIDPIILQAPLPTKFFCAPGGLMPIQDGDGTNEVGSLIDADCYQGALVPAKENINTFRDPGDEVNRQSWASSFGQIVAAALPDDGSLVAIVNVSHGATTFEKDVQGAIAFSSVTWLAGTATIVFSADTGLEAGDVLITVNPGGTWPATLTLDTCDGTTATVAIVSDPGTFEGSLVGMQPPMVNARRVVRYWHDNIAPSLGLTTYMAGLLYNGNEANDTATANWLTSQDDVVREYLDELVAYCDNSVSEPAWIIRGQVGYNVATWSALPTTMFNCGSNVSMAPLLAAIDPDRYNIVFPQYSSEHGAPSTVNNLHYQVQGHHDNGSRAGHLFLDAVTGTADHTPVYIVDGDDNLVRVANSTTITGNYNRDAVIDTGREVTDPGDYGFQVASGVSGVTTSENMVNGTFGLAEDIIDAVVVDGTDLEITLTQVPTYPWGNRVGYADGNGTAYVLPNATKLLSMSYDSGTGNATYEFIEPHGIGVGEECIIARTIPEGYAQIPGTALAGTTGTTLVAALGADPGDVTIAAGTWTALGGGKATLTFTTGQAQNLIINGNWVTTAGHSPAGWNGSWQILSKIGDETTTTGIVVRMENDPGTFVSGGTITGFGQMAIEGEYDIGNEDGPRGNVRAAEIDHYDNATGFPLPRWAARQRAIVDVYTSTKSIAGMLTELGQLDETTTYDDFFQLVFDFGNSTCYGGSGQTVTNLAATGNDTNYYRGLSSTDTTQTPTFVGTAGALDRTAYFEAATDDKVFTPTNMSSITASTAGTTLTVTAHSGANIEVGHTLYGTTVLTGTTITGLGTGTGGTGTYTISTSQTIASTSMITGSALMSDCHLPGGAGTIISLIRMPVSQPSAFTFILANARTIGSGQGAGVSLRVTPSGADYVSTLQIRGNAGASIYSTTLNTSVITAGNYAIVAASWQDGDASSWITQISEVEAISFTTLNCAYSAVSTVAPQTPPMIWRNGTGGFEAEEGCQIMALLASNQKMSREQALPLLRSLYRRHLLNLP